MRCKSCDYSLENLPEHRCPECGRAFDPNDPQTWNMPGERQRKRARLIGLIVLAALILFLIAAFIPVLQHYPVFGH